MLKLNKNIVPNGTIDGTNTTFTFDFILGGVDSITVDGNDIGEEGYSWDGITLSLNTAPTTSITGDVFERSVEGIRGNGYVTLGMLKAEFYRAIGRVLPDGSIPQNVMKIFPEQYVKESLRRSFKRIKNKSPESLSVQQYSYKGNNSSVVTGVNSENNITLGDSLSTDINGMFIVGEGVLYEYYSVSDGAYQVRGADIAKQGDKVVIGHKIPHGVKKIVSVSVDSVKYESISEEDFTVDSEECFTIIKDFNGQEYIFLPYMANEYIMAVKMIPDFNYFDEEEDLIDIEEEYMDVVVYDTAVKLLKQKEDERWASFQEHLGDGKRSGILYEYQSYIKSKIKKTKGKVKIPNER